MSAAFISQAGVSQADRNLFLLFRRRFGIRQTGPAVLRIFADTRYRLWVNGQIIGYGPTRFYPVAPEFDSYDLEPYLHPGSNEIRVEVNSRNASSYQAVPSQPGFWAGGEANGVSLATPGEWQVKASQARLSEAPVFSFAQGPVEILDTASLEQEWADAGGWETPVAVSGWGELRPRSLPQSSFPVRPSGELLLQAALSDAEERIVFQRAFPAEAERFDRTRKLAVALKIYSPVVQMVPLGLFWGENYLNGERLVLEKDPVRGNRQNTSGIFNAGWNLFYAELDVLEPSWGFTMSWPCSAGLKAPDGLRVSEALLAAELEPLRGPIPSHLGSLDGATWLRPIRPEETHFPAREVAWDVIDGSGADANNSVHLWDFGREFLGHLILDVESQSGAMLDVVADEIRREDGLLAIYASNPFVNSADRIIVPPGRTTVELFHPRGGRYVQVTARSQGKVSIHTIQERSALLHLPVEGSFECSDPLLNEIWRIGAATTEACLPDIWVDCPWREQGAYLGDTLVELHATRTLSSRMEIGRRALRLWSQGQRPDGLLPACVPAWYQLPHADFSLLYIILLRDYWTYSGDTGLVRELWTTVQGILNSPCWQEDESGLWTATPELRLFFDWGIPQAERLGAANGALNALRVGVLQAAAELAELTGEDSTPLRQQAQRIITAFREVLWRPDRNDFAPFAGEHTSPGHHANVLALRFGLASLSQVPGVLQNIRAAHTLLETPLELESRGGHLELYFIHFVLEALSQHGLPEEAASWIRTAWSPMVKADTVTFWESLHRGLHGLGSLCHAWSCAPMWFLSREVLGVQLTPGKPDVIQISPSSIGLQWAQGTYPHTSGSIVVKWRMEHGNMKIEAHGPPEVTINIAG